MSGSTDAHSLRILLVEDNALMAMEMIDELTGRGHRIAGSAATVPAAMRLLDELAAVGERIDVAVLDANLGGSPAAPIADRLRRARVPFVLASGYDAAELRRLGYDEPSLCKPFAAVELERALLRAAGP